MADEFLELPHQKVGRLGVTTDDGTYVLADFGRLPGKFPFLSVVPQWDFLDFLADRARRYPNFQVRMDAEVVGLLREAGQVTGVRYRTPGGCQQPDPGAADGGGRRPQLRAARGRRSAPSRVRGPHGRAVVPSAKPPDGSGSSFGGAGRITRGRMLVRLDRGDYWQCAYLVPKGAYATLKANGLESFRADLGAADA